MVCVRPTQYYSVNNQHSSFNEEQELLIQDNPDMWPFLPSSVVPVVVALSRPEPLSTASAYERAKELSVANFEKKPSQSPE